MHGCRWRTAEKGEREVSTITTTYEKKPQGMSATTKARAENNTQNDGVKTSRQTRYTRSGTSGQKCERKREARTQDTGWSGTWNAKKGMETFAEDHPSRKNTLKGNVNT
jgi:hypothetical protein